MVFQNPGDTSMNVDKETIAETIPRGRALTSHQERRLVTYLDERFLQCTRNFKKRSEISSSLRTITEYLSEARHILALILQIPPLDPSTSLRTFYLLRFTGDVLSSIPGYSLTKPISDPLDPSNGSSDGSWTIHPEWISEHLKDLLDFLDDLDHAWLAVLQGQFWDPSTSEGIDQEEPLDRITEAGSFEEDTESDVTRTATTPTATTAAQESTTTLPSQTDVTRLRSLILGGESAIEEWLLNEAIARKIDVGSGDEGGDLTGLLDGMGLLDQFDNLFAHTLDYLGAFGEDIAQVNSLGDELKM